MRPAQRFPSHPVNRRGAGSWRIPETALVGGEAYFLLPARSPHPIFWRIQMSSASETIVATLRKSAEEEVRISLAVVGGFRVVDLRVFSRRKGSGLGRFPTTRGITLRLAQLPGLISALEEAVTVVGGREALAAAAPAPALDEQWWQR